MCMTLSLQRQKRIISLFSEGYNLSQIQKLTPCDYATAVKYLRKYEDSLKSVANTLAANTLSVSIPSEPPQAFSPPAAPSSKYIFDLSPVFDLVSSLRGVLR